MCVFFNRECRLWATSVDVVLEVRLSCPLFVDALAEFVKCLLWLTASVHIELVNLSRGEEVGWYHTPKAAAPAIELFLRHSDLLIAAKYACKSDASSDIIGEA